MNCHLPNLLTPPEACDCHLHILDSSFRANSTITPDATSSDYARVRKALGTTRAVVVQPRNFGTDNSCTLEAIKELGRENSRGVAVIHPDIHESELQALHDGGIRGVRFSLYTPNNAAVTFDMLEPIARRIHGLGWHLQLHWTADQIVEHADLLRRLPAPLVFDHMARLPATSGATHPAFTFIRELLLEDRAWVKLSGCYLCTALEPGAGYSDVALIARAWIAASPSRVVWGSDWPHVTEQPHPPSTVGLLNMLAEWTRDEEIWRRILVDNPAELYDFNRTA